MEDDGHFDRISQGIKLGPGGMLKTLKFYGAC